MIIKLKRIFSWGRKRKFSNPIKQNIWSFYIIKTHPTRHAAVALNYHMTPSELCICFLRFESQTTTECRHVLFSKLPRHNAYFKSHRKEDVFVFVFCLLFYTFSVRARCDGVGVLGQHPVGKDMRTNQKPQACHTRWERT